MLKVIQEGFLGGDPELKYTPGNEAVVTINVCTTERWKDKQSGEKKERPTWIMWEVWGAQAENISKYLKQGSHVLIEGTVRNHKWFDDKTGEERYRDKYMIQSCKFLDRKPKSDEPDGFVADGTE